MSGSCPAQSNFHVFRAVHGGLREEHLQIGLLHAYHHLNFAWNVRRTPTAKYAALSKKQFEKWGRYPADIELWPLGGLRILNARLTGYAKPIMGVSSVNPILIALDF